MESKKNIVISIADIIFREIDMRSLSYNELCLVIDEAVTNAMEHGNHWDPEKTISVEMDHTMEGVDLTIEDQGNGFDPEEAMAFFSQSKDRLRPRGRGLIIINRFCKARWNKRGNRITLFFHC